MIRPIRYRNPLAMCLPLLALAACHTDNGVPLSRDEMISKLDGAHIKHVWEQKDPVVGLYTIDLTSVGRSSCFYTRRGPLTVVFHSIQYQYAEQAHADADDRAIRRLAVVGIPAAIYRGPFTAWQGHQLVFADYSGSTSILLDTDFGRACLSVKDDAAIGGPISVSCVMEGDASDLLFLDVAASGKNYSIMPEMDANGKCVGLQFVAENKKDAEKILIWNAGSGKFEDK